MMETRDEISPEPWMVIGFLIMSIYLAVLGGGVVYGFIKDSNDDKRIDNLVETNTIDAEITKAEECINSHERVNQIKEAIGITPDALIEVSGAEADPAEIEAFLQAIQVRVDETINTPACNLNKALEDLERLKRER